MPCFHPWLRSQADYFRLPCGQCIGCRLERSRQWAVRIMHEASLYDANCFITLTYDDAHLPADGSLDRRAFPLFMRRLRKTGVKARYYHCGEYGEQGRPHYHGCIFGYNFPDRVQWTTRNSLRVDRSATLERLWSMGISEIGSLTFESAAYVARYVTKKITGAKAASHYERVDPCSGELIQLEPEFGTMSNRPGIGAGWIDKFHAEVFPSDEVIVRGHAARPPRYYQDRRAKADPLQIEAVQEQRCDQRVFRSDVQLSVSEVCVKARMNLFSKRSLA